MSRGRFALLVGALVVVLGTASFLVTSALIDDDDTVESTGSTSTTSSSSTTTAPQGLTTPAFVAIVSSEGDEGAAQALRDELTEGGFEAGVLHSDDYTSLEPGFWVTYVGPFDDVAGADAAKGELVNAGYTASYSRCVGTDAECG